jgi:hypothetical protein
MAQGGEEAHVRGQVRAGREQVDHVLPGGVGGGGGTTGGGTISGNVTGNTVLNTDNTGNTGGANWSLTSPINYYIAVGSRIYIGAGPAGSQSIPAPSGNGITYSVENSISSYISVTQATGTTPAYLTVNAAAAGSAGAVGYIYAINTVIASISVNLSNNLSGTDSNIIFSNTNTPPETITLYANGTSSPANQTIATFSIGDTMWRLNPNAVIGSNQILIISPNSFFRMENQLINNGVIEFGASSYVLIRHILTNNGTINNYANQFIIDNYSGGVFYELANSGTFNNRSDGYIRNNSIITNTIGSRFVNYFNSTLYNNQHITHQPGVLFTNFGIFRNVAQFVNSGSGRITNYGSIYNYLGGTINNNDTIINNGSILNANGSGSYGIGYLTGTIPITATGVYAGQ